MAERTDERSGQRADEEQLSAVINAMNPAKVEIMLSLSGPGAPESLEEAVERIAAGKEMVPPREEPPLESR